MLIIKKEGSMKPNNIILECVVGSHMYNLQTETSDKDVKGIFLDDARKCLGLDNLAEVKDHTDPDWAYYELKKYCNLALKMNPTITELLWANEYTILTKIGKELISLRKSFLSKTAVNSYLGYALSQIRRKYRNAADVTQYRAGKHVRHLWRLCKQYEELATTGELRVKLTEQERKECFEFAEATHQECVEWFLYQDEKLRKIESVLPDEPDYQKIDEFLVKTRLATLHEL